MSDNQLDRQPQPRPTTPEPTAPTPQSEELLRLIAENVEDYAIFAIDLDGRAASWNPGVEKLFGYAEAEFVGRDACMIFTPEDIAAGACDREMRAAGEKGRADDVRWHLRKDGSRFWANGLLIALRDAAGILRGYSKIVRDDTARKESEDALRQSEERYRTLFDTIDEAFFVAEVIFDEDDAPTDYRFVEINPAFERLSGIRAEAALGGKTVRQLFPDLEDRWVKTYGHIAQTGEPTRFVDRAEVLDRWFDVYAFRTGQPEERRVAALFTNITERKRIEHERKRAEEERERLLRSLEIERTRLKSIFMQSPSFVATLRGPEHVFELANPAYLQLVGHRDLIGKSAREALPDIEGQGYFELLDRVYQTGEPYEGRELPVTLRREPHGSPEERFLDLLYQPLFDEDGSTSGVFAHGVDITDQVRARRAAEDANRIKDEFLATLSHELRTPLTAILGWSNMLLGGRLDPAASERALHIVERNARAQVQLIDDLLDIGRIITGKLRLEVRPVELAAVVEAAADAVRPAAEAKNIRLQVLLDSAAGAVSGDAERLQQVVWNLLSNAVKFTPKDGRVQVKLERVNSHVEISVTDTGRGIRAEFLPHVFDRFRQADQTSTRTHGGLGLGLSIVRQLVELHGGTIGVDSPGEDQGATFTVALPQLITRHEAGTPERRHPTKHHTFGGTIPFDCPPQLDGLRVLVVDDEEDTRDLLRAVLERCGSHVTVAASVREALAAIEAAAPEVLVSDIGMPEEDGYALIERVRARERARVTNRIPAIALTAYARVEDRVRAMQAGFQVHVPKPIEPVELAAVVASLAGRSGMI